MNLTGYVKERSSNNQDVLVINFLQQRVNQPLEFVDLLTVFPAFIVNHNIADSHLDTPAGPKKIKKVNIKKPQIKMLDLKSITFNQPDVVEFELED